MDWSWLAPATFGAVAGSLAGAATALWVSWVERRWRRQEVRAAEKRARLEERFELLVRSGGALQEFVRDATSWMWVWREDRPAGGWEHLSRRLQEELATHWDATRPLTPGPEVWHLLRDTRARAYWLQIELAAELCRQRCVECLKAGEPMSDEEAEGFKAQTVEGMEGLVRHMEEALDKVERNGAKR